MTESRRQSSVTSDGVFDLLEGLNGIVHTVLKSPFVPLYQKGEDKVLPL